VWGKYAAITRNTYGKGEITYIGFMPSDALAEKIMEEAVKRADLWGTQQTLHFPTIMRSGVLANGHAIHYVLNYSSAPVHARYGFPAGKDLLSGETVKRDGTIALPSWGVAIIEEGAR
jgi:beta-galactosidase